MDEYESCLRQAAIFREMAKQLDGYQLRAVLDAASTLESEAREFLRQSEQPGSNPDKPKGE